MGKGFDMRKQLGLAAALAAGLWSGAAAQAQEADPCVIDTLAQPDVTAVLAQFQYGFPGYDALCSRLSAAGMGVALTGVLGDVADRSYGLITVSVFDRQNEVESALKVTATGLDAELSSEAQAAALMRAINDAMQFLSTNPEPYITSAHDEVARLRTHFSEQ